MCGIIGAIGKTIDLEILTGLLLATEPRGKEASGFWTPSSGIVKAPLGMRAFLEQNKQAYVDAAKNTNIFIGHCRLSTHGDPKNNYNNHPIASENWTLVHNGVVHIDDLNEYHYVSDTDTENILAYIERFGLVNGLSKIGTGAAVILTKNDDPNSLYLWKTWTSDMLLGYDMTNEVLYICSGDKYMSSALDKHYEAPERLGGLFTILDRTLKIVEPKARELWKITYNTDASELVMSLEAEVPNNAYNRYASGWNTGGYTWRKKDADESDMVITGKYRPGVLEGRVKSSEQIRADNAAREEQARQERTAAAQTSQKKVVKNGSTVVDGGIRGSLCAKSGDLVELKRDITEDDAVYTATGVLLDDLKAGATFEVLKILKNTRVAVKDAQGNLYTFPKSVLQNADIPNCYGIKYHPKSIKCMKCLHQEDCKGMLSQWGNVDAYPECIGTFDDKDDDCMNCEFVGPCLNKLTYSQTGIDVDGDLPKEEDQTNTDALYGRVG